MLGRKTSILVTLRKGATNFANEVRSVDSDRCEDNTPGRVGHQALARARLVQLDVAPHGPHRPRFSRQLSTPPAFALIEKTKVEGNELLLLLLSLDHLGLHVVHRAPDLQGLGLDVLPPVDVDGVVEAGGTSPGRHPKPDKMF